MHKFTKERLFWPKKTAFLLNFCNKVIDKQKKMLYNYSVLL